MSEIPEDIQETVRAIFTDRAPNLFDPHLMDAFEAALLAERERDLWQPIETAPEQPAVVWGWSKSGGRVIVYVGSHHGEKRFYDDDAFQHGNYIRVTDLSHWQPLPKPPIPHSSKLCSSQALTDSPTLPLPLASSGTPFESDGPKSLPGDAAASQHSPRQERPLAEERSSDRSGGQFGDAPKPAHIQRASTGDAP